VAIDIVISKKDEVYAKIICEKHISKELSEFFCFFVPGYQFVPAYKNRIWDGKVRLYHLNTSQIYLGLLPYIEEFCSSRGYTFEYDITRPDIEDEFSLYHTNKFLGSLNLHSRGEPITPREHQIEALQHAMQKRRALLLSPTASGKSLIIYTMFRQLMNYQNLKGLILVPNVQLVEQLYSDFKDYSSHNDFDVENNVHRIYQGKDKDSNKKLYLSTWQSLYKLPKEYFEQFDYVIGDEAHLFKSQSIMSIMTSCTNTKYRIGLTGTLDGMKTHKLVLEGLFGSVRKVISTKELIDKKEVSDFEIKCLVLSHNVDICKEMKNKTYQEEISYLITNEQRNKFIKNLAVSMEKNTLVLFQLVDKHGKILYDMIRNTEKIGDRKVFFVHGGIDSKDREEMRRIVETEKNAIIVASLGVFSTGISIRNLHNIIFASPSKSKVRNLQSIGRGLRQSEGKTKAVLYDIADDMRHDKYMNYTLRHFVERVKIYTEEKFPFKIYKLGLKNG
jgi:superfamily II DNA or RNA helicase